MKRLLVVLALIPFALFAQKTKRVLFIGNSYTYVNNLPQMVADMAQSKSDTLIFDSSTMGGFSLQAHSTNSTTLAKIALGNWDYVVIQAQSQEPSFSPSQVATDVLPYAHKLDSLVHAASSCAETIFYMTWGRKNGDASNCAAYPPICTYAGMQERLRQSYLLMGQQNNASVCPIGCVWREVRNLNPSYDLYQTDQSHPSAWGSYVAACSFYQMMFQKDVQGSSYYYTLPQADAIQIQQVADDFFKDSLSVYATAGSIPFAGFNYSLNGLNVSFNNTTINGNSVQWSFGDGNTSLQSNPVYTYSAAGTYTVTLQATGNCMSDDYEQIIAVNPVSIEKQMNEEVEVYSADQLLIIRTDKPLSFKIFSIDGKLMYTDAASGKVCLDLSKILVAGIYVVELRTQDGLIRKKINVSY